MMSKRKPDQTITHRIELQSKERELISDYMMFEQGNKLIASLASMDIKTMYAWLNVFEALGIVDTPVPTVTDLTEIPAAIGSYADTISRQREQAKSEGRAGGVHAAHDEEYRPWTNIFEAVEYIFLPFSTRVQDKYRN